MNSSDNVVCGVAVVPKIAIEVPIKAIVIMIHCCSGHFQRLTIEKYLNKCCVLCSCRRSRHIQSGQVVQRQVCRCCTVIKVKECIIAVVDDQRDLWTGRSHGRLNTVCSIDMKNTDSEQRRTLISKLIMHFDKTACLFPRPWFEDGMGRPLSVLSIGKVWGTEYNFS